MSTYVYIMTALCVFNIMVYAHGCHGNLLSFYNIILYHWLTYYILRKYYDINSQPYMYRMI